MGERWPSTTALRGRGLSLPRAPPSTSGLGHGPFKAVARVRIPSGALPNEVRPRCGHDDFVGSGAPDSRSEPQPLGSAAVAFVWWGAQHERVACRHLLTPARGDEGYEHEGGYCDQEVENSTCGVAPDARLHRSRWRRRADLLHQADGVATAAPVELEERVGERGAVATQLRENEPGGRVAFPDEPVSRVSSTRMSAHVAREAVGPRPMVGADLPFGAGRANPSLGRESRRSGSPRPFCPWRQIYPHLALTDRSSRS